MTVPLVTLALELEEPVELLAARLAAFDGAVVVDDVGMRAVTRVVAAELLAVKARQDAHDAEVRARALAKSRAIAERADEERRLMLLAAEQRQTAATVGGGSQPAAAAVLLSEVDEERKDAAAERLADFMRPVEVRP
jgi:hypothetical protein